jgi:hypothetical protein
MGVTRRLAGKDTGKLGKKDLRWVKNESRREAAPAEFNEIE